MPKPYKFSKIFTNTPTTIKVGAISTYGDRPLMIGPDFVAGTGVLSHVSAVLQQVLVVLQQVLEPIGAQETYDSMIAQHW